MVDPEGSDLTQDLAKSHRYTLQLERQLRDLLQSPQGSGKFCFVRNIKSLNTVKLRIKRPNGYESTLVLF